MSHSDVTQFLAFLVEQVPNTRLRHHIEIRLREEQRADRERIDREEMNDAAENERQVKALEAWLEKNGGVQ